MTNLFYNSRETVPHHHRIKERYMSGFSTFALVILALAVVTVMMGVKVVSQGHEWTVERFGR